jgi:flavin-dependent dehydrogenase
VRETVVIGGGIGGLSAALFLARRGHPVTVLERDPAPPPATLDGVPAWVRRGTPQAGQSHAFVARCRQLLAQEAPDVLDALRHAGAAEIDLNTSPPPTLESAPVPDVDLVVLAARRAVFEWVLRRAVEAEAAVTVRAGAPAVGLLTEPGAGGVPAVRGVALEDGSTLAAGTVIDAGGRRSMVAGWLQEAGATLPDELVIPCGIAYCSRFFRRRSAGPAPPLNRGYVAGGSFDGYSCLVFPADNETFSVTFGILPEDRELRGLHDDRGFLAAARSIPEVAEWVGADHAEPLSGVATMRGLENRFRPMVERGRPAALGILTVGDAACITNPAHTRGSTLAVASGLAAARAVDEHDDTDSRALAVDAELHAVCEPLFWDSAEQDGTRLERWRRPAPARTARPPRPACDRVTNAEANLAAQRDPVVWRAFTRAQQLLEPPAAVLRHPDTVARVRAVLESGWRPPAPPAPSHDELVALAGEARLALEPSG